ncbi:MAG: hypothetical protein ACI9H8_001477 [Lysobacterales bacterium]|jgi:hypothetical protein
MSHFESKAKILSCLLWLASGTANASLESTPELLIQGQWLEVRGSYQADGRFLTERADLVEPERYQTLIGTISAQADEQHFTLLGQDVEIHDKTNFGNINPYVLTGERIKLEGYFRARGNFTARKISTRGEGRERILGRIDRIQKLKDGFELQIMNFQVIVPGGVMIRHEAALSEYRTTESDVQTIVNQNRDEEDMFGDGLRLSENLLMSGQVQSRGVRENEFNLNPARPRDRDDLAATFRVRFDYQPSGSFFAVAEINHGRLWRNDEDTGHLNSDQTRLGETFGYWIDPFGIGLDLQAGRIDFDEQREWLYDQNLDAVKAIWRGEKIRAELSLSETLTDGSQVDEATSNRILYVSNASDIRHFAGYLLQRDTDLGVPVKRTHYGVRASGDWLLAQESWLEVSYLDGRTGNIDNRGWALDFGSTWKPGERFALTAGYAVGQGDAPGSLTDHTFRQTGLHDNNAKFAGVTSFKYYGELVDPELANIRIMTAGIAWLPSRGISLDLVWHDYNQDELSTRLVDTDLDQRPNGRSKDIGSELDLVFGWQTEQKLDIEIVAAWFEPGKAFDNVKNAFLGKLQLRYRF